MVEDEIDPMVAKIAGIVKNDDRTGGETTFCCSIVLGTHMGKKKSRE